MTDLISLLQQRSLVWHGAQQKAACSSQSTHYPELDQKLDGGFPEHGVVGIAGLSAIGELRLLLPFLHQQTRLLVYIHPPGQICAEQLHHYGVELSRVLVIYPDKAIDALWAAEQCLKSGACAAVLLWQTAVEVHQVKRLQVAAETGKSVLFWYRSTNKSEVSLPVSLNLNLMANDHGLDIHINKRKGGWPLAVFCLDMRQHWPNQTLHYAANVVPFPISKAV